jgi:sulfite exporter TauE/SafE
MVCWVLCGSFGSLFSLTAYQGVLSFTMGVIFLLMGVGAITGVNIPFFTAGVNKLTGKLKQLFGFWFHQKQTSAVFVMGMLMACCPVALLTWRLHIVLFYLRQPMVLFLCYFLGWVPGR